MENVLNEWGVKYTVTEKKGLIHKMGDLNKSEVKADDHVGEIQFSQIMPDFRANYKAPFDMDSGVPIYSRVKRFKDGRYMVVYIDGSYGITFRTSDDLKTWTPMVQVLTNYINHLGNRVLNYSPDALILDDGTIIVVATFHDIIDYYGPDPKKNGDLSGIAMVKSKDGGKTWSEKKVIYTGINWEPMLLRLKSGEIQCYFTHTAPYIHKYGYMDIRSTGCALLRSFDEGETWTPSITGYPYDAYRVIQTSVGDYKGIPYFTDQMPVAVELNNGKIAVACEAITLDGKYHISVNVTDDNWNEPLGVLDEGPKDKYNIYRPGDKTYAPYIAQFPSGETVIHVWDDTEYKLYIADENAHGARFSTVVDFGGLKGNYWCNFELADSHSLITSSVYRKTGQQYNAENGILFETCYLNHRINASKRTVNVDGDTSEWSDTDDALFVGAKSQAQATLRAAVDNDNIYFLIERLDRDMEERDVTSLEFTCDGGKTAYRVTLSPNGNASVQVFDAKASSWVKIKSSIAMTVVKGDTENQGYLAEIAVPRSELSIEGDTVNVDMTLENYDGGEHISTESMFENVDAAVTEKGRIYIG